MVDYNKVLLAVAPHANKALIAGFGASIPAAIAHADLNSPLRLAHSLAQCVHESAGLQTTTEYASGSAYEGRRDLGNVQTGDGKRYKGRGLFQLTGRANYEQYGNAIGIDLIGSPEKAAAFPAAALTAAEYWKERQLNKFADADDIEGVTRRVNGGLNGLASRKAYLAKAKHALTDLKGALLASADEETAKARAKTGTTATVTAATAGTVVSTIPAVDSPFPVVVVVICALVGIAVVAYLIAEINRHKQAAVALSVAAQGA